MLACLLILPGLIDYIVHSLCRNNEQLIHSVYKFVQRFYKYWSQIRLVEKVRDRYFLNCSVLFCMKERSRVFEISVRRRKDLLKKVTRAREVCIARDVWH